MKTYDGMIVSSGPYEFVWTEDTDDEGRRSGWWECSRCGATGFGDTFTGDHGCWYESPTKLATLIAWMRSDGWDDDEIRRAIEKPWNYNDEAREAGVR